MKQSRFLPVALIATGLFLLLNQFDLLRLNRAEWVMLGSALIGFFLLRRAFLSEQKKGLLGGVFFVGFAAGLFLMDISLLPISEETGLGMMLLSLGLANLVYFAFTRLHTSSVVFGLIYSGFGAVFLFSYYEYIDWWSVADIVELYWPGLLILFGLALLIDGMRRQKNSRNKSENSRDKTVSGPQTT